MGEYISREKVERAFKLKVKNPNKDYQRGMQDAIDCLVPEVIADIPAADVQPVKHGEWRRKFLSDTICCSECKVTWSSSFKDMLNGFNYCPNCGARMGGDTNG